MKAEILILEDDPVLCSSLRERLLMEGYEVRTAANGRIGFQLYQEHPVDLIITDVLMPEMDGLEVIRRLRETASPPFIIAMSGGGVRDMDFLMEAAEFGATRTLPKPFSLKELVDMVRDVLKSTSRHHTPSL